MRSLAIALACLSFVAMVAAVIFLVLTWSAPLPPYWGFRGYAVFVGLTYTITGLAVAIRRRANPIGWLMLASGILYAVAELFFDYAVFAIVGRPSPLAGGELIAWAGSWTWTFNVVAIIPILLLLYPDGSWRFPRLKWPTIVLVLVAGVALAGSFAFRPGPLQLATYLDNPYVGPDADRISNALAVVSIGLTMILVAIVVASLVSRARRSTGVERQQLKWLAIAGVPYITLGPLNALSNARLLQLADVAAQAFVPVAIGIAILRYRLYDIDVLINRTLVYGALSATLVATYAAFVILLQGALRPFTGGSELAVAASTLATLALVQPFRRRIQDAVDRRFYRRRYDAVRLLDSFSARLRDEVDIDALRTDLLDVVGRAVEPANASLWLRETKAR